MSFFRKDRRAFRPSLGDVQLEDRVTMTSAASMQAATIAAAATSNTDLTRQQVIQAYRQQAQIANQVLKNYIQAQTTLLFLNGTPTAEQRAAFNANVRGAINASAMGLASQASLLPNATALANNIQNNLLGTGAGSLTSRINAFLNSRRGTGANIGQITSSLNQLVDSSLNTEQLYLNRYFNTTPINRLAVDTNGNQVGLRQYLGQQAINQFNNSLGSIVNNVGSLAGSTLFNGTGTPTTDAINGFQRQFGNALNTAAFQLGNNLALFRNNDPTLLTQLNSGLFNNTTDPTTGLPAGSLINSTMSLFSPVTFPGQTDFNTSFQNNIGTAFTTVANPIFRNFGLNPTLDTSGNVALPNGFFQNNATFPNVFNSNFAGTNFNNGFNNGFATTGVGFPGFGTAPTGFDTNFGTGFNNYVSTTNSNLLFSGQPFGVNPSFGLGGVFA